MPGYSDKVFRPGQRVICVEQMPWSWSERHVEIGEVYTVAEFLPGELTRVRLEERPSGGIYFTRRFEALPDFDEMPR